MAINVHSLLAPGTAVEVSNLFTGTWSSGFRVMSREGDGYRIVRSSDGSEVPALFPAARLRPIEPMGSAGAVRREAAAV